MNTLNQPNPDYLLEAGLDSLHAESRIWSSNLEFMNSEMQFYMKLLTSKVFQEAKEQQRQHVYENMNKLCVTILNELMQEVKAHEKNLAALLSAKSGDDAAYRAKHRELRRKVEQLDNDVKTLKMLVFAFIEHVK